MFDFRYHVVSLAAVFLALVIGIVVGVGLADRGLLDKAKKSLLEQQVAELNGKLERAEHQSAGQAREVEMTTSFISRVYPRLMRNRLHGKRIAVVFIGQAGGAVSSSIAQALRDAGAPSATPVRAIKVPVDGASLDASLGGDASLARYVGDSKLENLGRELGEELVLGGKAPLWSALSEQLVAEQHGSWKRPLDGVVVARTVPPQYGATGRFLRGFYSGLVVAGARAVAVHVSDVTPTPVDAYRDTGVSSVDDVDKPQGRLALALLLAGGQPGQYGLKRTASDGVLPPPGQAALAGG